MSKEKCKCIRKTSIGGQALMEGIMMRGPQKCAMAVRRPNGEVYFEEESIEKKKRPAICRWPIIRGVVGFIDSMTFGYKCLMRSAEISGLEELEAEMEKEKAEKKAAKKAEKAAKKAAKKGEITPVAEETPAPEVVAAMTAEQVELLRLYSDPTAKGLKEKLAAEGLFDLDSKRKIPMLPKRVAVITSDTGAALQDILNVISRRFPLCEVVVCGASVQGELAVGELINALDRVYNVSDYIDTIIIGRGGGSKEDLDAFNDEALARKIYASPVPVISAVGHETDITICDMVADLRAPTPSAAAELAVPDKDDFSAKIVGIKDKCRVSLMRKTELMEVGLKGILSRPVMLYPHRLIEDKLMNVDKCTDKITSLINGVFEKASTSFSGIASKIEALSPVKTMLRGFAFAEISGKPLTKASQSQVGDSLILHLSDGKLNCTVTDKEN